MSIQSALRSLVYGPSGSITSLDLRAKSAISPGGDSAYGSTRQGYGYWSQLQPSSKVDYKTEAGDPALNAVVQSCVQWIARTFPESPLRVMAKGKTEPTPIIDHPLTTLLAQPNQYYNGILLWAATLANLNISGNAYWLKVRNKATKLVELWWEPDYTCRPYWDTDREEFILGYEVRRNGQWLQVPGGNNAVVHYRLGLDPHNPRLGLSPLAAALREIFTDNEAANFTASLVRNMGVPGVVISPANDQTTIDDPEGLKRVMMAKFGGDRRGEPLVMQGPTKVDVLSFSPAAMNLETLRNIPEERICALLGIPPIVAGMGSGLERSTYANTKEAKESAYHSNILPTQALLAAQITTDLIPEFGDNTRQYAEFDTSKVQALAEDRDALYKRVATVWTAGVIKRSEARAALNAGYVSTPDDDLYRTDIPTTAARLTEMEAPGTLLADDPELDKPQPKPPAPGKALARKNGHATVVLEAKPTTTDVDRVRRAYEEWQVEDGGSLWPPEP